MHLKPNEFFWSLMSKQIVRGPAGFGIKRRLMTLQLSLSIDELEPWVVRIKGVAKQTRETYVITNNHFRGQGAVNALEIKAALDEESQPAPEPLFKVYPRL